MEMPLAEVIDRFTILRLKKERLNPDQKQAEPFLEKEFAAYNAAIEEFKIRGINIKDEWLNNLYEINKECWDIEADIRQGKEGILGLEEVGRRALAIRDINKKRIAFKNLITKESGVGFFEIKVDHASVDKEFLDKLN